jgi:crossover junction endodeoxyribonuclease RusA
VSSVTFTLPYPPSVNRYWRSVRGRNILSKEAREYRERAHAAVIANGWRVTGPVRVNFLAFAPDKRRRDADNLLKPMLDALVNAGAIEGDDSRYVRGVSVDWWGVDPGRERVEVVISEVVVGGEKENEA